MSQSVSFSSGIIILWYHHMLFPHSHECVSFRGMSHVKRMLDVKVILITKYEIF